MNQDQEDCMGRVEPLHRVLHDSLHHGMQFYHENYPDEAIAQHRDRTSANCVFDHAFHKMRDELADSPGCHFLDVRGLEVLNYWDLALIRLKKVDGAGRWKNYATPQQQEYDDQLPMPGLPPGPFALLLDTSPMQHSVQ